MLDWINSWSRSAGPLMIESFITRTTLLAAPKSDPAVRDRAELLTGLTDLLSPAELLGSDDAFDPGVDDLGLVAHGEAQDELVQAILQDPVCRRVGLCVTVAWSMSVSMPVRRRGRMPVPGVRLPSRMASTQAAAVPDGEFHFTAGTFA